MKLKRLPEDFQVEELTAFAPGPTGEFALYRLTKRGLGTPETIQAITRRWQVAIRVSRRRFGGSASSTRRSCLNGWSMSVGATPDLGCRI